MRGGGALGLQTAGVVSAMAAAPPASPRRLTQEALRNSTATRMSASGSGNGDGPPIHRATRVFSPETDTAVVKKEGLAALQRFVQTMEAVDAARRSPTSDPPAPATTD